MRLDFGLSNNSRALNILLSVVMMKQEGFPHQGACSAGVRDDEQMLLESSKLVTRTRISNAAFSNHGSSLKIFSINSHFSPGRASGSAC
jgi:hypothetical protein